MELKLKVCGMRESENIREVNSLHPDYMGFIFYKHSPRCVPDDFSIPVLDKNVQRVGVFVNEKPEIILECVEVHKLDVVQLHGEETVLECKELKSKHVQVMKVFFVHDQFDFRITESYERVIDFFLFDAKGKNYGGNGQAFNWELLHQYNQRTPFFLSGGISPENINEVFAFNDMNLYGIDVNSGVEIKPGFKDVDRVRQVSQLLKNRV